MKSLLLAGAMIVATGAISLADGLYWVVGNHATGNCDIVTSNPTVVGDIWFEDGPYTSLDDAKLARSTIRICPQDDPAPTEGGIAAFSNQSASALDGAAGAGPR